MSDLETTTETLACMECQITFDYEHDPLTAIDYTCPQCGGISCCRTDSTAFVYAVDSKLKKQGKSIWEGHTLEFEHWKEE